MGPTSLAEASKDLRYLLSRGYRREGAVRFVGDRYRLREAERLALYRCVYDAATASNHNSKLVRVVDIAGRSLSVDGYNVLITTESLLRGALVVISDDGLVRDLSSVSSRYKISALTSEALKLLVSLIKDAAPSRTSWFFDAPIPRSGELASIVRKELRDSSLEGDAATVKSADVVSVLMAEVVASSDSVAVERASKVLDLPREVAAAKGIDLSRVEDLELASDCRPMRASGT